MSPFSRQFYYALSTLSVLIGFALLGQHSYALPTDNQQPITLQSDSAEFDRLNGTTTYAGNVVMEQGSMKINAEKIVIYGNPKKATKIIAIGNPAKFQQTPEIGAKPVQAKSGRLEYQIQEKILFLIDNAELSQDGSLLSGPRIEYDVERAVVQAGESSHTASSDKERVRMVIPPLNRDTNTRDKTLKD